MRASSAPDTFGIRDGKTNRIASEFAVHHVNGFNNLSKTPPFFLVLTRRQKLNKKADKKMKRA
jgi:hypothetical protein